jgi:hypothetical protein
VEAIERGERLRGVLDEAQVALGVVGDREDVVGARAQEAVARAAVELRAPAVPRVVRVRMAAALEVGCEPLRLVDHTVLVGVLQPRLVAVGVRHPAEVVIERPVLHHQDDDRVDRDVARRGQVDPALVARCLGDERVGREDRRQRRGAGGHGGALQELAPAQQLILVHRPEATPRRTEMSQFK